MRRILCLCLILVLLTGCVSAPAETTAAPAETTAAPTTAPTEPMPTEDPADSIRTGYYLLTGISDGETSIDGFAMAAFRGYLQINPNRTGLLSLNGVIEHVEWSGRYLTIDGITCKFTIENDVMQLNYKYEFDMEFTYSGDEIDPYYLNAPLEPGMYILTHYVQDGETWYFENPDITLGYFHLLPDGTGMYYNGETEYDLSWKNDVLIISSTPLIYQFFSAEQTEDGVAMLILHDFGWDMAIFRAIDDNVSDDL